MAVRRLLGLTVLLALLGACGCGICDRYCERHVCPRSQPVCYPPPATQYVQQPVAAAPVATGRPMNCVCYP